MPRSLGLVESKENTMTFYEAVEELKQKLYEFFVGPLEPIVIPILRYLNKKAKKYLKQEEFPHLDSRKDCSNRIT